MHVNLFDSQNIQTALTTKPQQFNSAKSLELRQDSFSRQVSFQGSGKKEDNFDISESTKKALKKNSEKLMIEAMNKEDFNAEGWPTHKLQITHNFETNVRCPEKTSRNLLIEFMIRNWKEAFNKLLKEHDVNIYAGPEGVKPLDVAEVCPDKYFTNMLTEYAAAKAPTV